MQLSHCGPRCNLGGNGVSNGGGAGWGWAGQRCSCELLPVPMLGLCGCCNAVIQVLLLHWNGMHSTALGRGGTERWYCTAAVSRLLQ